MSFIRLHITVEGQTEERFVKNILVPHLGKLNISIDVRCVLTSKDKNKTYRGGLLNYEKAKSDISTWLKEDNNKESRYTTMFDLYALPNNFPGYADVKKISDPYQRVKKLEGALKNDIKDNRFIPYIQLHEFEALILADPLKLQVEYLDRQNQIQKLCQMVQKEGGNPELIDDGNETAPSKRILKEIPEYDKVSAGSIVTQKIGLEIIRDKCLHFNDWLIQLESLSS